METIAISLVIFLVYVVYQSVKHQERMRCAHIAYLQATNCLLDGLSQKLIQLDKRLIEVEEKTKKSAQFFEENSIQ